MSHFPGSRKQALFSPFPWSLNGPGKGFSTGEDGAPYFGAREGRVVSLLRNGGTLFSAAGDCGLPGYGGEVVAWEHPRSEGICLSANRRIVLCLCL